MTVPRWLRCLAWSAVFAGAGYGAWRLGWAVPAGLLYACAIYAVVLLLPEPGRKQVINRPAPAPEDEFEYDAGPCGTCGACTFDDETATTPTAAMEATDGRSASTQS